MTISTLDQPGGRRYTARRDARHGEYAALAGNPKAWSAVFDWTVQWSRWIARGAKSGLPQKWAKYVEQLATDSVLHAWSAVCAAAETIIRLQVWPRTDRELEARWSQLTELEVEAAGALDIAKLLLMSKPSCVKHLRTVRSLAPRVAMYLLELAAIADEKLARLGE